MKEKVLVLVLAFIIILATPTISQDWDSFTFEEIVDKAIKVLADNNIDWMDFYFMTESGLMFVPQYTEYVTRETGYITTEDFRKEGGIINIYSTFVPPIGGNLSQVQKLKGMSAVIGIVIMKRISGYLILVLNAGLIFTGSTCRMQDKDVFHVNLKRNDSEMLSIGRGFYFDEKKAAQYLERYAPVLPRPLPDNSHIVFSTAGPFFGILEKIPGQSSVKFTLDVNLNQDLTDDAAVELPVVESWKEGTIIKVARTFDQPEKRTEWLPYRISYQVDKAPDGTIRVSIYICSNYRYEGEFRLRNKQYEIRLFDGDVRGRFIREKLVNVFVQLALKSDIDTKGAGKSYRLYELVQLDDRLYEFTGIAEDGSWIEFVPGDLPTTALGKPAPDMEMTDMDGQVFHLSDYQDKVLLLGFWTSYCKPCIAKFPDIKKMIQRFEKKPFAVIGINIDEETRVELAKKIIADYELTWRQVIEGKGEFIPVYQVYGRLPERAMIFPIYVAIDEQGISRYASNDYQKMERFLKTHFTGSEDPQNVLFVPLTDTRALHSQPIIPVDFTGEELTELVEAEKLKMPEEMPNEARIGRLPNGTMLIVWATAEPDKLHLILDSNRDFDLTNDEGKLIPVLEKPDPDDSEMTKIDCIISYTDGARGFYSLSFFARPVQEAGEGTYPEVLFCGTSRKYEGIFFEEGKEYNVEIYDPSGDFLFTPKDTANQDILTLKTKKNGKWVILHQGTSQIPIGNSLYHLRYISDDGNLIELEKEK